ncbi:MAG: hypothetical protein WA109_04190 [Bellilinea sp.]
MNKPEFSDLYKFIVSLGLLLIVFALLVPWLFLRESFDGIVSASEIEKLTLTAQTLILSRQNIALWFVQNIIWISLIPAILGLISLISGIVLWRRKQILIDQKDYFETEKLRLEVKKMSPEQIVEKAIIEVSEEVQAEQIDNKPKAEISTQFSALTNHLQTEKIVIEKLANCFGINNVRPHLKVGNTNIDILLRLSQKERAIVEIKSIRKPSDVARRQKEVIDTLLKIVKSYNTMATTRITYGIGLLIIKDEYSEFSQVEYANNGSSQLIDNKFFKIISITEKELVNLECAELRTMLLTH